MQMHSNDTNKIIYPELSYQLTGLSFKVQNNLGRYCREKQYADALETLLKENNIQFIREKSLPVEMISNDFTNRVDFDVESKILIDIKAKPFILKEDYYQMQRYLKAANYKLGLVINFRSKYLKPIRIIRID